MQEEKEYVNLREQRVKHELLAHTENDVLGRNYRLKDRFPHIWHFPSRNRIVARIEGYLENMEHKRILDLGCGRGQASLKYLEYGAVVHGIDISPTYVSMAKNAARLAGYGRDRFTFQVMDAHNLEFDDNGFDFVVGLGILHHLETDIAMNEIYRVLKPEGRVLLLEPLGDNPLLKIFRLLTPQARSQDEHPFSRNDIKGLCSRRRWRTNTAYCGLIEAPVAMMTSLVLPNHQDNVFLWLADRIERWTHEKQILLAWNQYVLFNMVKQSM